MLALIAKHRNDPRPDKLDLGVGVHRDAEGPTPVMRAIRRAEEALLGAQTTKVYLGAEGDPEFVAALAPRALVPARMRMDASFDQLHVEISITGLDERLAIIVAAKLSEMVAIIEIDLSA